MKIDDMRRRKIYLREILLKSRDLNNSNSRKNATVHYRKEMVELFKEKLDFNYNSCLRWVKIKVICEIVTMTN